ncbi:histidine kinase [Metasolibacillus sp.]|uniref:GAF domain-containing sensor histidine kinase n=1 Tax=Metasolibacillus sp. TaxID=2703680 RepID=UPI0025F640BC|nr:histidine kinase [Metasolibacillus sp.]MCT6926149.1 histidine kinase [Metasolibacillus sp.]MCT6942327.1 histidine kinase [Metasolibacillus sp.]
MLKDEYFIKYVNNLTAQLLTQAAFLGRQFKLQILAEMAGYTLQQLQESLQVAINHQLIYRLSNEQYTFQHEDIRQVFEQRVSEQEREQLHLKVGQILLCEGEPIVRVVWHFNQVQQHFIAEKRQLELIELNFQAAKEEMADAIYYLQHAMDLLLEEHWQQYYELVYAIYQFRVELALTNEDYDIARSLCQVLLLQAQAAIDKAQVYLLLIQLELYQDRYDQVLELGKEALALLRLPIKLENSRVKEYYYWFRISRRLGKKPSRKFPLMQNKRMKLAARILVYVANACFVSNREGWFATVVMLLEITWDEGITDESAYGFASYALIQSTLAFDNESAYAYSKFASELVKDNLEMTMQINTIIMLSQDSWRKYEPNFLLSITDYANQHGVLSNNKWQTNYSFLVNLGLMFNFSYPLKDLYAHLLSRSTVFGKSSDTLPWQYAKAMSSLLTRLTGYSAANDPFISEHPEVSGHYEGSYLYEVSLWYDYIIAYLFGDYESAYEKIVESIRIDNAHDKRGFSNMYNYYYYVLIVKELFADAELTKQVSLRQETKRYVKKLQYLARHSPENYLHKYLLAQAEYKKMLGQTPDKVGAIYEEAVNTAARYGYVHDVGIISECFAKYSIQSGKQMQAKVYMNEAYMAYKQWGADAKADALELQYGHLLLKKTTDLEHEDYLSIVSSAQALSEEIEIEQLLHKLLHIMLQNAGAEYGALLLEHGGSWFVEAHGTAEKLIVQSVSLQEASELLPITVIDYTIRMRQEVVFHNVMNSGFTQNAYIRHRHLKSVLCLPITHQNKLISILYMENNMLESVFTEERLDMLKLLCSQCAISITNARLYSDIQYLTRNLEQQVEERTESLQKSMKMTSEALAEMSVYAERNRIAQEIHDIVGHTLTSTVLQIEAGRRLLAKDIEAAVKRLIDAQDLVRHSLSEIRNSVHMLKEDKYYDIEKALYTLIEETAHNTGVSIYVDMDKVEYLPAIMKKLLYHALQEGLTNGIRHGYSSEFQFTLKYDGELIFFELLDNGDGAGYIELGFGLRMMKDRVEQLKGTFSIETAERNGCILRITLPYRGEMNDYNFNRG